jgi:putative transposase
VLWFCRPKHLVKVQTTTELLSVLQNQLSNTSLQHFIAIVNSVLSLSRPATTLSVARMSDLSYRTVQRFYSLKNINWHTVNLILFKTFIYKPNKIYLLAADETVEGKAGKHTHGIGHFYSSIVQKAIKSVSFLATVIIDVEAGKSYFLACKQVIQTKKEEIAIDKKDEVVKKKGRKKGSKNKPKCEPIAQSYQVLKSVLCLIMSDLSTYLPNLQCFHFVLDGFYGHEDYLLLALKHKLYIISKFKHNAHLVLPFDGLQSGRGRPKTKGDRVDLTKISQKYLIEILNDKSSAVITHVYQFNAYTPKIAKHLLNIVVLVHVNKVTKKESRTILFSTDLTLKATQIIKYYSLRFQIEFDFRDAKQFYGLADFKNYKETQVTNAVNLSFTMTLIGKLILEKYKKKLNCQGMGISDLKVIFRLEKQVQTLFKDNRTMPDDYLNSPQFLNLARLEAIHV